MMDVTVSQQRIIFPLYLVFQYENFPKYGIRSLRRGTHAIIVFTSNSLSLAGQRDYNSLADTVLSFEEPS